MLLLWQCGRHSDALVVQSIHQSDRLISRLTSKFADQCCSVDMLSKWHLMIMRVPWDMGKVFSKDTSLEINKFPKNEPINFRKFFDSDGVTQLLWWSDHFVNSDIWFFLLGLNLIITTLVNTTLALICH